MKLIDTFIFSGAIALTMIGIHQSMTVGFKESYLFYMLAISLLFWYLYRKGKTLREKKEGEDNRKTPPFSGKKPKK